MSSEIKIEDVIGQLNLQRPALQVSSINAASINTSMFSAGSLDSYDVMFTDVQGVKRSLKDFYARFTFVENQEMTRLGATNCTPISPSPACVTVSKEEYDRVKSEHERAISLIKAEHSKMEESLKQVLEHLVDRIKKLEADLADRPRTTATPW